MEKEKFLYKRVYTDIKSRIQSGALKPGDKMAGEQELIEQYGVSSITIKKALTLLAEEGLLYRVRGKGSFVAQRPCENAPEVLPQPREPLVGVIFEHISSSYGLMMLYELECRAREAGYRLLPCFSYGNRELETDAIRSLNGLGVEGLLIMPVHGTHYNKEILRLVLEDYPLVLIDKKMDRIPVLSVRSDGCKMMSRLVQYLYEEGKRHLALVTVEESDTSTLIERKTGFYEGIRQCGLTAQTECRLAYVDYEDAFRTYADIYKEQIYAYLEREKEFLDGLVCAEYGLAMIVTELLEELGCRDTIEVCCVDENYIGPNQYRLSHMKQDERRMADCAMDLLLARIRGEHPQQEDYLIPGVFVRKK
ncbi:MAG: GntR family transcriptional regulator [Eubacteriales bacterium]|nr:GntR family transcriptional regulator [Eubacteriales bacterium]